MLTAPHLVACLHVCAALQADVSTPMFSQIPKASSGIACTMSDSNPKVMIQTSISLFTAEIHEHP